MGTGRWGNFVETRFGGDVNVDGSHFPSSLPFREGTESRLHGRYKVPSRVYVLSTMAFFPGALAKRKCNHLTGHGRLWKTHYYQVRTCALSLPIHILSSKGLCLRWKNLIIKRRYCLPWIFHFWKYFLKAQGPIMETARLRLNIGRFHKDEHYRKRMPSL